MAEPKKPARKKAASKKAAAKKASPKNGGHGQGPGRQDRGIAPQDLRGPKIYHRSEYGGTIRIGRRHQNLMLDPSSIKDWDDEELLRGYQRDKNGRWTGRPPAVVPAMVHQELVRRKFKAAEDHLRDNLELACKTLTEIIASPAAEDKDKLRAIGMLFDRVLGQPKQTVELSVDAPVWQTAMAEAVVVVSEEDEVIDVDGQEVA